MIYDVYEFMLFVCVLNLLQDIHQFACRQIDAYLSQARAPKNTHHYILITLYILIIMHTYHRARVFHIFFWRMMV